MLFNSYVFILVFLPLCICSYYLLNHFEKYNLSLVVLLGMSLYFYGYITPKYIIILIGSIVVNWCCSRIMLHWGKYRKLLLVVGICFDIGLIFYFKYYDFFVENINYIFKSSFNLRHIALPLGISFFTFQQISYLVDSYRGETARYNFLQYAAFVSFFPQLVAGPIVLHSELIPQFEDKSRRKLSHESLALGIFQFSVGLFKKVLLADTFGKAVTWAFFNIKTEQFSSLEIYIIMLCYTFQIYFDFSGYSDMAIGIGNLFHITLPINFDSPYKADSILEFWNRWHMTLTRFLKIYIYIPLGGSRKGKLRTYVNVMIVFLISGLWHGANWTFVVWGALHGIANVLNRIFKKQWEKWHSAVRWLLTFAFLNITWLIFRVENLKQGRELLGKLFRMDDFSIHSALYENFRLPELLSVGERFPFSLLTGYMTGAYMWLFLLGALLMCLNANNIYRRKFKPNVMYAFGTMILLTWSILSLAGDSTFIYFNF